MAARRGRRSAAGSYYRQHCPLNVSLVLFTGLIAILQSICWYYSGGALHVRNHARRRRTLVYRLLFNGRALRGFALFFIYCAPHHFTNTGWKSPARQAGPQPCGPPASCCLGRVRC